MSDDIRREMVELLPRLRRFAYSLTGSMEEADDMVQTACVKALSRLDQFKPGTRLDSWMFRIIQTTWLDHVRSAPVQRTVLDPDALDQAVARDPIEERTMARAALEKVRQAMSGLPEDQRILLGLVVVDGLSYRQAAESLGIPIGTVMSRLSRARRRLADAIESPRAAASEGSL
ncbi:MAG: RNA polymerase sigma factor [Kiloniellales bacterium]|nr:RNA polymerase sigma factor [Kiloniellales bacterium]MDJ0981654.1 RNA polymerase sigma factor [Kiloniellales bacterium]